MKIYEFDQYSEDWWSVRRGVPTASNFSKIVTSKGEPSKSKEKYMYQLAGEFVSGASEETYQNAAMVRGLEMESEARAMYELIKDVEVKEVGFCLSDGAGCSPDGMVGEDGLIEIKCPSVAVSVDYLLKNKLPTDYLQQVQGQLYVTGRKWCDFVSYFSGLRPLIIRVERDEDFISKLSVELKLFVQDLQKIINKIK